MLEYHAAYYPVEDGFYLVKLLTDRARKVMQLANQEAQRFSHLRIGTEHILLGLVKESAGVAANVLKNRGIDLEKIRLEVEKIVQTGPEMVILGKLSPTPSAKKVIEHAIEEARNLNHNYVGTEHVLLGLIRSEGGVAARVLLNLGLSLDVLRAETIALLGPSSQRTVEMPAPDDLTALPAAVRHEVEEIDRHIELRTRQKEDAIAEQDFERAALLRDQVETLKKRRNATIENAKETSE